MAEKEYIERGALIEAWERERAEATDLFDAFDFALESVPVADVVEVVHGKWELHGNDDDLGSSYWCSHCYYQVDEELFYPHGYDEKKPYKYCPNCGAMMDGE